ncbi:MAG TPA: DUF3037 domain-containing protein [Conexibacter sp.]|jgi:hypothetical protein|nr:DUF3037 domain-containing protein [Conexibacter sp.]
MAYKFSLIRFVPDPARGEFVNIGAIAGDEGSDDWAIRWISNYKRANALDFDGLFPAAKAFSGVLDERLADLDRPTLGTEPPSVAWLTELATDMNNLVQLTEPAPVVADSAEAALDRIFDRLLVDPARPTYRFKKKHQAQAATKAAYTAHGVPHDAVKERVKVTSAGFDADFDFAVHNGRAVQLVQCWSFQLPNQTELADQVKSWAWVTRHIRDRGGCLTSDGELEVPADLDIAVVYIPPDRPDRHAFSEAQKAFRELTVTVAAYDSADGIGARAAAGLRH